MSIFEIIKYDSLVARKNKSPNATLLVTVMADAQTIAKNENREVTDQDCIAVIKKHIKGLDEMIATANCMKSTVEKIVLTSYLPSQLSESQMREIIAYKGLSAVPDVMKFFKENYPGQYDGKLLSQVAKG